LTKLNLRFWDFGFLLFWAAEGWTKLNLRFWDFGFFLFWAAEGWTKLNLRFWDFGFFLFWAAEGCGGWGEGGREKGYIKEKRGWG
jgi:hypothetical protein